MAVKKLKTAFLGVTPTHQDLLDAVGVSEHFEITALGVSDAEAGEKLSRQYDCAFFSDYRQLVIQNQVDLLFVTGPIYVCEEHVRAAMKKGFNIVKTVPASLNFEQAAEFFGIAKKEGVGFIVAKPLRFSPGFLRLKEYLQSNPLERFGLISCLCNVPDGAVGDENRWLSDPKLAGGGVLLRECYELIDQIVSNFGLPQQVYCLSTNDAPDKQQRLLTTEDTAVVVMKFSDTLICTLTASWKCGPLGRFIRLHSGGESVLFESDRYELCDCRGDKLDQCVYSVTNDEPFSSMLRYIAEGITGSKREQFLASQAEDLMNMAVIESAYVSSRTLMPEDPGRILEMVRPELKHM